MREGLTHHSYHLDVLTPEGQTQTLSLEDLKNPAIFDTVKHDIDQNRFFSLIDLCLDDYVLQCRKAELLIAVENDKEAFSLLKDNPLLLARGLEAKLYSANRQNSELSSLISQYIWLKDVEINQLSDLDKEGLVHIFEMAGNFTFRRNLGQFSVLFYKRSASLAKDLKMIGRMAIIANHESLAKQQIGQDYHHEEYQGGNSSSKRFIALAKLRTSWLEGCPELDPTILRDYSQIVNAWKGLCSNNPYKITSGLDNLDSGDSETRLFKALLQITAIAEIGLENKRSLSHYLEIARLSFSEILYSNILVSSAYKLFPLGFLIAAHKIPEMQSYAQEVPILLNEKYRDGLRLNKRTIVLPNEFRRAWLEDDIHSSHISQLSLLDKSTRHRAHKKLKANKIKYFNIVSIVKYVRAVQNLVKLGYHDYAKLEENLLTSFPKVKNYLT